MKLLSKPPKLWPCAGLMFCFLLRKCGALGYDLHNDESRLVLSISVERMGKDEEPDNIESNQHTQPREDTEKACLIHIFSFFLLMPLFLLL